VRSLAAAALFAVVALEAAVAFAGDRVAVVIGDDVGEPSDAHLRYARSDARRMADLLVAVGDVAPADLVLLEEGRADAVRAALAGAERRLAGVSDGLLIVYYSGHADAEALHLSGTRLPLRELQATLRQSAVATRLLIIDACRAGALTNMKGGTAGGAFPAAPIVEASPRGFAIVSSGAAGEDAQESDEIGASFFSHHLTVGLLGAADANGDGGVTLGEAFAYASQHTTASTAATWAGPQHPTYRIDLGGREDLVLARVGTIRPGLELGYLTLKEPGRYVVRREGEGRLVAEIASDAVNRPLVLRAGRYEVTRRGRDHLMTGVYVVSAGGSTGVSAASMSRLEYGRAVRKGGAAATAATAVFATGGYRGSLLGLGGAPGGGLGARVDLRQFSATLSLDLAAASIEASRGSTLATSELALRAGIYRAFELARLDVAVGAEIGGSRFDQSSSAPPLSGHSYAATLGPSLLLQLPIYGRTFATLQAALPVYLVHAAAVDPASDAHMFRATYRVAGGVGAFL
jgi:hypothetical protein